MINKQGFSKIGAKDNVLDIQDLRLEGKSGGVWMPILKGVSLSVNRGEVLGVIGESGAGKSSLGLASMGYTRIGCRATGGRVIFQGRDILGAPVKELRELRGSRIAYVAQSAAASFNPAQRLIDQTIEVVVQKGLVNRRKAISEVQALYAQLNLPDPEHIGLRYPHQVSGGQLQRIMTAMAISSRPDLIVFDEPTTALDVTTQVEVLAAVRNVVETSGVAAIYITHDLAIVAQMADRILVLRNGVAVEEASTKEMLASPIHDYTKSLWAVRSLDKPAEPDTSELLKVDGVSLKFGKIQAVDNVSLSVQTGRTVAIVGESGSGKSTLARIISGLQAPDAGRILLRGDKLSQGYQQRDKNTLRDIQIITQSPDASLNQRQRVSEIIGRPLSFYFGIVGKERDKRVDALLQMVELDVGLRDRFPSELSGGQKQRVSIARAFAAKPSIIICDEITSSLDCLVQQGILDLLLKRQREDGTSYVFITHDIATVRAVADKVVVMHQGRVVEQGTKDDVLHNSQANYTQHLLSCVPEVDVNWLKNIVNKRADRPTSAPLTTTV